MKLVCVFTLVVIVKCATGQTAGNNSRQADAQVTNSSSVVGNSAQVTNSSSVVGNSAPVTNSSSVVGNSARLAGPSYKCEGFASEPSLFAIELVKQAFDAYTTHWRRAWEIWQGLDKAGRGPKYVMVQPDGHKWNAYYHPTNHFECVRYLKHIAIIVTGNFGADADDPDCVHSNWMTIQRRRYVTETAATFKAQDWNGYKNGFGHISRGNYYWSGLQFMHEKTERGKWQLLVEYTFFDNKKLTLIFNDFMVTDEEDGYRLLLGKINSTSGIHTEGAAENFLLANEMRFSTRDKGYPFFDGRYQFETSETAKSSGGGWWYLVGDRVYYGSVSCPNCYSKSALHVHTKRVHGVYTGGYWMPVKRTKMAMRQLPHSNQPPCDP